MKRELILLLMIFATILMSNDVVHARDVGEEPECTSVYSFCDDFNDGIINLTKWQNISLFDDAQNGRYKVTYRGQPANSLFTNFTTGFITEKMTAWVFEIKWNSTLDNNQHHYFWIDGAPIAFPGVEDCDIVQNPNCNPPYDSDDDATLISANKSYVNRIFYDASTQRRVLQFYDGENGSLLFEENHSPNLTNKSLGIGFFMANSLQGSYLFIDYIALCANTTNMSLCEIPPHLEDEALFVPKRVVSQERLRDNSSQLLSGMKNHSISIYENVTGGSSKFVLNSSIFFSNGWGKFEFNSIFPSWFFSRKNSFMGISIESDQEFIPRTNLSAIPYAFVSEYSGDAEKIRGLNGSLSGGRGTLCVNYDGTLFIQDEGHC